MKHIVVIALAALAILLSADSAHAQQQEAKDGQPFRVDTALARAGKIAWSAKGCSACHTIGKGKIAAPDLNGLYDRREIEWVRAWLKNTDAMLDNDETAQAMLREWFDLRMPDMKLTDAEVEALMHYIAEQQLPKKK